MDWDRGTSFADYCLAEADELWQHYAHHEWIESLALGSLTDEQFAFFHRYDVSYSADMHRALAVGVAKAPTGCDWARAALRVLYESFILDKQQRKQRLLGRIGMPATVPLARAARGLSRDAYANHVLRVGWEQPTGVLAAALLPCAMFTEIIGARFAVTPPATRPEIVEWVRGYVNECDADMTRRHAELMDLHARAAGAEGRRAMLAEFGRSVEYQTRVFDAAMSLDDNIVAAGRVIGPAS